MPNLAMRAGAKHFAVSMQMHRAKVLPRPSMRGAVMLCVQHHAARFVPKTDEGLHDGSLVRDLVWRVCGQSALHGLNADKRGMRSVKDSMYASADMPVAHFPSTLLLCQENQLDIGLTDSHSMPQ